ncbi:hypothetical protein EQG64_12485 [Streptomyces sp. S6]|nr:hypothetical protein EQG64_12485 [Streptomyces sp. S6]
MPTGTPGDLPETGGTSQDAAGPPDGSGEGTPGAAPEVTPGARRRALPPGYAVERSRLPGAHPDAIGCGRARPGGGLARAAVPSGARAPGAYE